ncbi:MAG: hypothetical protein L0H31_12175 [Nocardioidaceae bacterium]|nr:hypothetical protein [Nocardioidaceae bacterium]
MWFLRCSGRQRTVLRSLRDPGAWQLVATVLAGIAVVVALVTTARWFLLTEGLADYVAHSSFVVLIAVTGGVLFAPITCRYSTRLRRGGD